MRITLPSRLYQKRDLSPSTRLQENLAAAGIFLLGLLFTAFGLFVAYGPWQLGSIAVLGNLLAVIGGLLSILILVLTLADRIGRG